MRLSIVVPCYNEEAVLQETAKRLLALMGGMVIDGRISVDSELLFVDDGSRDRTWQLIEELAARDAHVRGIKLSHNRGHQNALLAGLMSASGDAIVSIDADLQDDIGAIVLMVDRHRAGSDIVYGVRSRRARDTWFKRCTAQSFYRLMNWFGAESIFNHADFRLMSRRALEALRRYDEVNLFLRGLVPLLGYRTDIVEYERGERFAGESKYPLRKMIAFALEGVTSFSVVPLRVITFVGFAVFGLTLIISIWVLWVRLFSEEAVPGWASTVLPLYFIGGVQILCIGIVGEYLGKTYQEVKRRPRYIVETVTGMPMKPAGPLVHGTDAGAVAALRIREQDGSLR
ncbi:MAG: glycosyltransferase family 2 protein [Burkholderiales bacterium]|nr:glycosyltransferase family 2 protein [Burkholderiales bacterium]